MEFFLFHFTSFLNSGCSFFVSTFYFEFPQKLTLRQNFKYKWCAWSMRAGNIAKEASK